jgi:hypothetical protein
MPEIRDFNKQHLRNAIRTLKRYILVKIEEHYANSMGTNQYHEWIGKIKDYKIVSYEETAQCKLLLHIQSVLKTHEIEFYIPYDSEIIYGDVTKGKPYTIDYINSGPHCQYTFKKLI